MRLSTLTDYTDVFLRGFRTTVALTIVAALGALVIGTLLAAMRVGPVRPLRIAATAYVEVLRNTPLVVLAVLFAFGLPQLGFRFSFTVWAGLALMLYSAAFVCEALRSGMNTVAAGQGEAARALGLGFGQTLRLVVLPQAFRTVVGPLGNIMIALTKNSSVAAVVGAFDLTAAANSVTTSSVDPLGAVVGAAVGYLVLTLPMGVGVGVLERRVAVSR